MRFIPFLHDAFQRVATPTADDMQEASMDELNVSAAVEDVGERLGRAHLTDARGTKQKEERQELDQITKGRTGCGDRLASTS